MADRVSIPVQLQISNLQDIVKSLQNTLGNLKIGTKGYRELEGTINRIQNNIEKLQLQGSKPFVSERQFTTADKTISQLEENMRHVASTMQRIKFGDLELNDGQKEQLKSFEDEIENLKKSIASLKNSTKESFLSGDFGALYKDIDPAAVTRSFDEIGKRINKYVNEQVQSVNKAKEALKDYQNAQQVNTNIDQFLSGKNGLDAKTMGKNLYDQIFQNISRINGTEITKFTNKGRSLLEDYLIQQYDLDPSYVHELVSKKASEVLSIMTATNSEVTEKLKASQEKAQEKIKRGGVSQSTVDAANQKLNASLKMSEAYHKSKEEIDESAGKINKQITNVNTNMTKWSDAQVDALRTTPQLVSDTSRFSQELENLRSSLASSSAEFLRLQQTASNFNAIKMSIANFMGFRQVLNVVKSSITEAANHIKELDTVMNKISIVTDMSTGDLWGQVAAYSDMAQKYGTSIKGAYEVSQIYYQQGLSTNEVLTLTDETLKLAKVSGLDYATTTDYMTTALRGFKIEAEDAGKVVDVYSNLAAHTAVSQEELAVAMSKTASSMESVGATFEETSAMIGTMVAVTRESPTNIGSAMKSIASRYGELTKDPTILKDSEGEELVFNKVDAALQSIGISMHTVDGQFRSFTEVITELGEKWDELDSTQQRYVATQFAGNRQQSRFLALISNIDTFKANLEYAEDSENTGTLQALKALDSIEAKTEQVRVAYQQMYTSIGAEEIWKGVLDLAKDFVNTLNGLSKPGALVTIIDTIKTLKNVGLGTLSKVSDSYFNGNGFLGFLTGGKYRQKILEQDKLRKAQKKGKASQEDVTSNINIANTVSTKQAAEEGAAAAAEREAAANKETAEAAKQVAEIKKETASAQAPEKTEAANVDQIIAKWQRLKEIQESIKAGTGDINTLQQERKGLVNELHTSTNILPTTIQSRIDQLQGQTPAEVPINVVPSVDVEALKAKISELGSSDGIGEVEVKARIDLVDELNSLDPSILEKMQEAVDSIDFSNLENVKAQISTLASSMKESFSAAGQDIGGISQDIITSIIIALAASRGQVQSASKELGGAVLEGLRSGINAHSPSPTIIAMFETGVGQAIEQGLTLSAKAVTNAAEQLGLTVTDSLKKSLDKGKTINLGKYFDKDTAQQLFMKSAKEETAYYSSVGNLRNGVHSNYAPPENFQFDQQKYQQAFDIWQKTSQLYLQSSSKTGQMVATHGFSPKNLSALLDWGAMPNVSYAIRSITGNNNPRNHMFNSSGHGIFFLDQKYADPKSGLGEIFSGDGHTPVLNKPQSLEEAHQQILSQPASAWEYNQWDLTDYLSNIRRMPDLSTVSLLANKYGQANLRHSMGAYYGVFDGEKEQKKELSLQQQPLVDSMHADLKNSGITSENRDAVTAYALGDYMTALQEKEAAGNPLTSFDDKVALFQEKIAALNTELQTQIQFSEDTITQAINFIDGFQKQASFNNKFDYLEGKATQDVPFSDILSAVLPQNLAPDLLQKLSMAGLSQDKIHLYDPQSSQSYEDAMKAATAQSTFTKDQNAQQFIDSKQFEQAGDTAGESAKIGILGSISKVFSAAVQLGQKMLEGLKSGMNAHSPSPTIIGDVETGFGEAVLIALEASSEKIIQLAHELGIEITESFKQGLESGKTSINLNELVEKGQITKEQRQGIMIKGAAEKIGLGDKFQSIKDLQTYRQLIDDAKAHGNIEDQKEAQDLFNKERTKYNSSYLAKNEKAIQHNSGLENLKQHEATIMSAIQERIIGQQNQQLNNEKPPEVPAEPLDKVVGAAVKPIKTLGQEAGVAAQALKDVASTGKEAKDADKERKEAAEDAAEGDQNQGEAAEHAAEANHNEAAASNAVANANRAQAASNRFGRGTVLGVSTTTLSSLGSGLSMLAGTLPSILSKFGADARTSEVLGGVTNLASGALKGVAGFFSGNPMAMISGVLSVINGIDQIIENDAEKLERLTKESEEAKNESLKAAGEYKELHNAEKKLVDLQKKRYDSEEDAEAYQSAVDDLTSKFPNLISSFDEAGNAILNETALTETLTKARQESAQAAFDAAKAEVERAKQAKESALKEARKQFSEDLRNQRVSPDASSAVSDAFSKSSLVKTIASASGQRVSEYVQELGVNPLKNFLGINIPIIARGSNRLWDFINAYAQTGKEYIQDGQATSEFIEALANHTLTSDEQSDYNFVDIVNLAKNVTQANESSSKSHAEKTSAAMAINNALDTLETDAAANKDAETLEEDLKAVNEVMNQYYDTVNDAYGLNDDIASVREKLSKGTGKLKEYTGESNALRVGINQQVTSKLRTAFDTSSLIDNSTGFFELISSQVTAEFNKASKETPNLDFDSWWAKTGLSISTNLMNLGENLLTQMTDDQQKEFKNMAKNQRYYSAETVKGFLNKFNIDWNSEAGQQFEKGIDETFASQKQIKKDLESKYKTDGTELNTLQSFQKNMIGKLGETATEATRFMYNEIIDNSAKMFGYGTTKQNDYNTAALNFVSTLNGWKETEAAAVQQVLESTGYTAEGMRTAAEKIRENKNDAIDDEKANQIATQLEAMANSMLVNIGLTFDAQLESFVENWTEVSKNISSGLSGMDASTANKWLTENAKYLEKGGLKDLKLTDLTFEDGQFFTKAEQLRAYEIGFVQDYRDQVEAANKELDSILRIENIVSTDKAKKGFSAITSSSSNIGQKTQDYINMAATWASELGLTDLFTFETDDKGNLVGNAKLAEGKNLNEASQAIFSKARELHKSEKEINEYIQNFYQQQIDSLQDAIDVGSYFTSENYSEGSKSWKKLENQIEQYLTALDVAGKLTIPSSFIDQIKEIEPNIENNRNKLIKLYTDSLIATLEKGGTAAVQALKQLHPDATAEELDAAFNFQINKLRTAQENLGKGVGETISGIAVTIAEASNFGLTKLDDGTAVINSIGDMVTAHKLLYQAMENNNASIADKNTEYANILTAIDQENIDTLETLQNAYSMSYQAFADLMTQYGQNIKDVLGDPEHYGSITSDGFGKLHIEDFKLFAEGMGWDLNDPEIKDAYNDWVEARAEWQNKSAEIVQNAADQLKNLSEAKAGEAVNISYLQDVLNLSDEAFNELFKKYNVIITNGLLQLEAGADIPGLITDIANQAAKAGQLLPEQLAELADAVEDMLSQITSLITGGIKGSLSNVDAQKLTAWAKQNGISNLNFVRTTDGLRLATDSAKELYSVINQIDSIQGQIVFDALKESLVETNDKFKTIQNTTSKIAELERNITGAKMVQAGVTTNGGQPGQVALFDEMNGNVDLYNRNRIKRPDIGEDVYSTIETATLDSRNFETDIPFVMNITPIPPDAQTFEDMLSSAELDEYVQSLLDQNPITGEALLELDKVENGGKGLIINLRTEEEITDEIVENESDRAQVLHEVAAVYEDIKAGEEFDTTKIDQYTEELNLAKQINAERSTTEDDSFKFMENKIPSGQNNPLNYWENWAKAFDAMKAAGSAKGAAKNTIAYEDFYNIVSEMGRLADITGEAVVLGEHTLDNSQAAADLITQAAGALKNVDGKMVVDLSGINVDFTSGLDDLGKQVDAQVDALADSQIAMLDSLIALLEVIVAMENLQDVDADADMTIDLDEIFEFEVKGDPTKGIKGFTEKYDKWRQSILDQLKEYNDDGTKNEKFNKDLSEAIGKIKIDGINLKDMIEWDVSDWNDQALEIRQTYSDILSVLFKASLSDNYDEDNVAASIQQVLKESGLNRDISIDVGDYTVTMTGGQVKIVDWTTENAKDAIARYIKTHKGATAEDARNEITKYVEAYNNGETLDPIQLQYVLEVYKHITVKDGQTIVTWGNQEFDASTPEGRAAIAAWRAKDAGADISDFNPKTATAENGYYEFTTTVGSKSNVKVRSNGTTVEWIDDTGTPQNTQDKMIEANWKEAARQEGYLDERGNVSDDFMTLDAYRWLRYNIRVQTQTKITDKDGKSYDPINDPSTRQAVKDIRDKISNSDSLEGLADVNDEGNIEVPLENGLVLTLSGEGIVLEDESIDQAALIAELAKTLGLDTALQETITTAITEAFKALPDLIKSLNETDTQGISKVAGAIGEISTNANDAYEKIVQLIEQIAKLAASLSEGMELKVKVPETPEDDKENKNKTEGTETETNNGEPLLVDVTANITGFNLTSLAEAAIEVAAKITELNISGLGENNTVPVKAKVDPDSFTAPEGLTATYAADVKDKPKNLEDLKATWTGDITGDIPDDLPDLTAHYTVTNSGLPPSHIEGTVHYTVSGGGGCFVAGTKIYMADGTVKNIEDVYLNDVVIAYNTATNEFVPKKVIDGYTHHNTSRVIEVIFSDGTSLKMTPSHPIWTNKGWRSLDPITSLDEHGILPSWLEIGDKVNGYYGEVEVTNIHEVSIPDNFDTYDFEVEDCHTFLAEGIPVHNAIITGPARGKSFNTAGEMGGKAKGNATWLNPMGQTFAKGNVSGTALAGGRERTLMGELGPELYVTGGRYYVAGQNGAEFVNLPSDAIVFNHMQTKSLMSKGQTGHGKPVTNEKTAISWAKGGGPALASASAALAALKQLRAMWQSLKSASVSDLAGAGGGGGGGGGGGDNAKIIDPRAWVDTVERWFDLMQKIAKCEREITHEETLRKKLQSDWLKNGKQYFASQTTSLKSLREQINLQEELNVSRRDYFNKRIEALENEPLGKLYKFNAETGEMQFKGTQINGKDGVMEFLTDLVGFDSNKGANYTNKEKYDILMKAGFANYMKFDSNGMPIKKDSDNDGETTDEELESYYENATKAFWEHVDEFKESTESLFESIAEGENKLLELQASMNEIWEEMRDNQMEVENEVLEAIEDMKQREIDALQDERDKLEESVSKYIDGLTDALNKEQEMYEDQEAESELNRKRRQLGILQRSGASAADISSLQSEIDSSARDMYFDAQQRQIDAIQEASDKQLERMDTQIQLMTEQLEYQKMYGLLWNDVYSVMNTSAQQITDFIVNGNSKFWAESPLSTQDKVNELIFKTEQWDEYKKSIDPITKLAVMTKKQMDAEAYNTFNQAMTNKYGANYDKGNKYTKAGGYQEKFNQVWKETGDVTKATETARAAYAQDKKYLDQEAAAKSAGKAWMKNSKGDEYKSINDTQHWHYYYTEQTIAGVKGYYFQKAVKENHNWSGDKCSKCGHAKPKPQASSGGGGGSSSSSSSSGCGGTCTQHCKSSCWAVNANSTARKNSTDNCSAGCSKDCTGSSWGKKRAHGGYVGHGVYELGEQGTETVLTASQTRVLRNNILSNRPNSLISLLKTYNSGFNQNKLASYSSDIQKRNEASESVNIENATVNMNVSQIANDYDARRAGEQAMNEIMRIARKTSAANSIRR